MFKKKGKSAAPPEPLPVSKWRWNGNAIFVVQWEKYMYGQQKAKFICSKNTPADVLEALCDIALVTKIPELDPKRQQYEIKVNEADKEYLQSASMDVDVTSIFVTLGYQMLPNSDMTRMYVSGNIGGHAKDVVLFRLLAKTTPGP